MTDAAVPAPRVRRAACRCGAVVAVCTGEPIRVSVCHCRNCQRRTGMTFSGQMRFPKDQVVVTGETHEWTPVGEDGGVGVTYRFCPVCGSTLGFSGGPFPDAIAILIGNFEPEDVATPSVSVWEPRKPPWLEIVGEGIVHD